MLIVNMYTNNIHLMFLIMGRITSMNDAQMVYLRTPPLINYIIVTFTTVQLHPEYRFGHGSYIIWYLINRCARKEQSLLFDLYKAFD